MQSLHDRIVNGQSEKIGILMAVQNQMAHVRFPIGSQMTIIFFINNSNSQKRDDY